MGIFQYNTVKENALKATLTVLAILPLLLLSLFGSVPLRIYLLGSGSWGFGLIIKMLLHQAVVIRLSKKQINPWILSGINGFISGLAELSVFALMIILMRHKLDLTFFNILGFGLAIGSLECIIVAFNHRSQLFRGTALENASKALEMNEKAFTGSDQPLFAFLFPVLERILGIFLHVSTRGLVILSLLSLQLYPSVIALLVFVFADGLLGFHFIFSEKLKTKQGYYRFYLLLTILTLISVMAFIIILKPHLYSLTR